jgi:hypothetical protein
MSIVSESVAKAKADIDSQRPEIDRWSHDFIELLDRVTDLDLVFTEAGGLEINYLALCEWADSSRMVIIETIPPNQTVEQRKKTLAKGSVIASLLHKFGHSDVAVALLADDVGKMFRFEGIAGCCKSIRGCSRVPEAASQFDFSSIPGHVMRSASSAILN